MNSIEDMQPADLVVFALNVMYRFKTQVAPSLDDLALSSVFVFVVVAELIYN